MELNASDKVKSRMVWGLQWDLTCDFISKKGDKKSIKNSTNWGNYVNAELYGPVIEAGSPWSWIPFQVYADGAYHHPTFLYESVWDLLGFFLLLSLIRRLHRIGMIFSIYLMFTSFGRFFIEIIRMDMLMLFGVRQCYITCPLMFLTGAILSILIRHRPKVDVTAIPKVGEPRLGRDYYKYKNKK